MKSVNPDNFSRILTAYNSNADSQSISFMPSLYIIEPTNYCNLSCPICPNSKYLNSEKGFMNIDLYKRIIHQISEYADLIQLFWVGEPLLNNDLAQMISIAKANTSAKISISTNGILISSESIQRLIDAGLDEIIVSMDAASSNEVYNSVRKNGDLITLNNNVKGIIDYSEKISIILKFIITNTNRIELDEFIEKWKPYNVSVKINCLYTWANQMPELRSYSDYLSPVENISRVPCSDLWYKIPIHWNGDVSLCCFDWSFNHCVGNIASQSVFDIWNSAKMVEIRKAHKMHDFISLCKNCDAWATPSEYEELL